MGIIDKCAPPQAPKQLKELEVVVVGGQSPLQKLLQFTPEKYYYLEA